MPISPGTPPAAAGAHTLPLPHERDESPEANVPATEPPQERLHQAKADLDAGLVDTELRNVPGLDAQRQRQLMGSNPTRETGSAATPGPRTDVDPATDDSPPAPPAATGGARSATGSNYGNWHATAGDAAAPADDFHPDYLQWRGEQLNSLDNEYRLWREDQGNGAPAHGGAGNFSDAFSRWRSTRQATVAETARSAPTGDAKAEGRTAAAIEPKKA